MIKYPDKYFVLKTEDLRACMTDKDVKMLFALIDKVVKYRKLKGKNPVNAYLVLNDEDPLTPIVWKLLELYVDQRDKIDEFEKDRLDRLV